MEVLRVVTLAGDSDREAELAPQFASEPTLELYLRCVDRVELLATMRSGALDAIIAVGAPGWFDAQSAREAARAGIRVVGLAGNSLEAEALGHRGAAVLDAGSSVGQIVDACRSEQVTTPVAPIERPNARSGDVIVVWGPKGAPGRTTIAIELACALAATGEQTVLVDADPYGGDVLQMLGVAEELPSVLWAATAAASDDGRSDLVRQLRKIGDSGPLLVPGLPRAELWTEISDYGYADLVKLLASSARFVVFDVGFCVEDSSSVGSIRDDRNLMARSALARADRIVAVCRADPIGVKNFIWSLESLRDFVDEDRVSVVLNRSLGGEQRAIDDLLTRHTGFRSVVAFPDRPTDCRRAIDQGGAIHEVRPSSEICSQARTLAERFGGKIRPQGLLAKLAGRS